MFESKSFCELKNFDEVENYDIIKLTIYEQSCHQPHTKSNASHLTPQNETNYGDKNQILQQSITNKVHTFTCSMCRQNVNITSILLENQTRTEFAISPLSTPPNSKSRRLHVDDDWSNKFPTANRKRVIIVAAGCSQHFFPRYLTLIIIFIKQFIRCNYD